MHAMLSNNDFPTLFNAFSCAMIEKIAKGQRRTHRHSAFLIMRCTPPHAPSGRTLRDDSRLQNIKNKSYLFSSGSVEEDFPKTFYLL